MKKDFEKVKRDILLVASESFGIRVTDVKIDSNPLEGPQPFPIFKPIADNRPVILVYTGGKCLFISGSDFYKLEHGESICSYVHNAFWEFGYYMAPMHTFFMAMYNSKGIPEDKRIIQCNIKATMQRLLAPYWGDIIYPIDDNNSWQSIVFRHLDKDAEECGIR